MSDLPCASAPIAHVGAGPPAGADPRPGGEGLPSLAEARAARSGPKWYRLGPESWAMIVAEYQAGATAKQLSLKWGPSPGSIYRHVGEAGATKQSRGEALDLEAATRFAEREAEGDVRLAAEAERQAEARAEGEAEHDPDDAADILMRRAAARSLRGRTDEALALLKTADALRRAACAAGAARARADDDDEPEDDDGREYTDEEFERAARNLTRNLRLGPEYAHLDEGAAEGDV